MLGKFFDKFCLSTIFLVGAVLVLGGLHLFGWGEDLLLG